MAHLTNIKTEWEATTSPIEENIDQLYDTEWNQLNILNKYHNHTSWEMPTLVFSRTADHFKSLEVSSNYHSNETEDAIWDPTAFDVIVQFMHSNSQTHPGKWFYTETDTWEKVLELAEFIKLNQVLKKRIQLAIAYRAILRRDRSVFTWIKNMRATEVLDVERAHAILADFF